MRAIAGIIPILEDGRLLFISTDGGHYIFPKGGVKKHEAAVLAAQREAYEEAGIKGNTTAEPAISVGNKTYFIMKVDTLDDIFRESARRTRLVLCPQDVLSHESIPNYVKSIVQHCLEEGIF